MNPTQITRKITATLFAVQSLATAAFLMTGTVNTIAAAELGGSPVWAGVPSAVLQFGAALAALGVGATMDRTGRRVGLGLGILAGGLGGVLSSAALVGRNLWGFFLGLGLMGVARAAMQLGRFAAAEVHPPHSRGRAISYVVLGGTVGSVVGPLLVGPAGKLAKGLALGELAGPYLFGVGIFAAAAGLIFLFLRPDPREIGLKVAAIYPESELRAAPTRRVREIFRSPTAMVAVTAMVFGQMVMVALMGITSLHMKGHAHDLSAISLVFSAHTIGMFGFSILTGQLADRWGRGPVILTGGGILLLACALAPLSPDLLPLSASLLLLGLGWNLCYVGGSALLSDVLSPDERAKTQGANDLLIGLATAGASLGSGVVFAYAGYAATGIAGALLALVPLGMTGWWMAGKQGLATA